MKIGVLNNLYEPFNRGGAEKITAALIGDLQAQGQEVFLITTKPPKTPAPIALGLKIYHLNSSYYNLSGWPLWQRFFWQAANIFSFRSARQIKKILRQEKPDLIITHNLMGLGFLAPRIIKNLKIRHEHFLHDIQLLHPSGLMFYGQEKKIDSLAARLYQALTRCLFASPAQVTSPSQWLLGQYQQRGFFRKSELIVKPFKRSKNQPADKSGRKNFGRTFLFVGQMVKHKGIFLLIKAFKELDDSQARLSMVGNGADLNEAKKLAENDGRINFFPWSEETESQQMAGSDFLVVPSLCYENSPTVIYKAQAVGLPVIASDLGGIPEIVGQADFLFKPELKNLTELLKTIKIQN